MAATSGLMDREFTFSLLKSTFLRFCAWECDEFRALLPPAAVAWLMGNGAREAIVRAGASELIVTAVSGDQEIRISGAEIEATSLDAALSRHGLSRKSITIVLEMPPSAFLTRGFEAPSAALGQLSQMLDAEIARKTPFRRDEVLLAHQITPHTEKGKAIVQMTLIRRDLVGPAVNASGLAPSELAAIRAETGAGEAPATVVVPLGDCGGAGRRLESAALSMMLIAVLLAGTGLGAILWRQSRDSSELDARIAEMSVRATRVRQIADNAGKESRLLAMLHRARQNSAPFTELWEEVSRIIPDSAYLTNLRLNESNSGERSIELAGFAQSSTGLPLLFEKSSYFTEATLTAPIMSDPREKRESFSLRLKIRAHDPVAAGSSDQTPEPRR